MKPNITNSDDGKTTPKVSAEYLRRNDLHAKAQGVYAGIEAALFRIVKLKRIPKWLLKILYEERFKASAVAVEMARHRDEIGRYEE